MPKKSGAAGIALKYKGGMFRLREVIRPIIEDAGWSWSELANRAELTPQTVLAWFKACKSIPDFENMARLAETLEQLEGFNMTPAQLYAVVYGEDWRNVKTDKFWPDQSMPTDEYFLLQWDQMTTEQRLRVAPALLAMMSRDLNIAHPEMRPERRLAELLAESFSGYHFGPPGIAGYYKKNGAPVPLPDVERILEFRDPFAVGDLSRVPLKSLTNLALLIRDEEGDVGAANTALVLELANRVQIQKILLEFMAERNLKTPADLVQWACNKDGFKLDAKQRKDAITAFTSAIQENRMISQFDAVSSQLLNAVGREIGVPNGDDFRRLLLKGSKVEDSL